jgi:hypothetical protein
LLGSRQSVQVTVLAGGAKLVGAGLGALDPPPVHPAAAVAATSRMTHRRRTDITFAPYRRTPSGKRGQRPGRAGADQDAGAARAARRAWPDVGTCRDEAG